ncbi:nicotinate-nucleotide pyrophosphorylase [Desulfocarbo indianensis]|nr:nicotinate-nucleotide pyrophosphorylase [Desulfocarbo indianensis]
MNPLLLEDILRNALKEDIGRGDVTSEAIMPKGLMAEAQIISRSPGVLAGQQAAAAAFRLLDPQVRWRPLLDDGAKLMPGQILANLRGRARALLAGERVALNLLQRLSGIATATAQAVRAVEGMGLTVVDTRKTTPGLRMLEKEAVRAGGGRNHRHGLDDAVLIKDNHLRLAGGPAKAVALARRAVGPLVKIEVEAETLEEVSQALEAGADVIMLDNMTLDLTLEAVKMVNGRALVEASGNLKPEDLPDLARAGVDFASLGWLTHSAPPLDLSLEMMVCDDGKDKP